METTFEFFALVGTALVEHGDYRGLFAIRRYNVGGSQCAKGRSIFSIGDLKVATYEFVEDGKIRFFRCDSCTLARKYADETSQYCYVRGPCGGRAW